MLLLVCNFAVYRRGQVVCLVTAVLRCGKTDQAYDYFVVFTEDGLYSFVNGNLKTQNLTSPNAWLQKQLFPSERCGGRQAPTWQHRHEIKESPQLSAHVASGARLGFDVILTLGHRSFQGAPGLNIPD